MAKAPAAKKSRKIPVYNPETKRVEMKEAPSAGKGAAGDSEYTTFVIKGEQLQALLQFAKEDGVTIANKGERGRVVNSYTRAALQEFVASRQKARALAAVVTKR